MKYPRLLLIPAAATALLLAFALPGSGSLPGAGSLPGSALPPETRIEFKVEDGATNTKTFKTSIELNLDDLSMTMNGQESPMPMEIDMSNTTEFSVVVEDEYVSVSDGRPAELKRAYDTISSHTEVKVEMDMMGTTTTQDMPISAGSELEGMTVRFKWNEDEKRYDATFAEEKGEEELLEDLFEDMDFRALLPSGAVSPDDEWSIEASKLASVLAPGGNLKLVPEDLDAETMMGMNPNQGSMSDWFGESLEGEVVATFKGTRKGDDGTELGVIELRIDISNAVDLTEMVSEMMENAELPPEAGDMEIDHMDIEVSLEAEGTLLWNLAAGRAESFELSGDFSMLMNMGMSISSQGMDMEIETSIEMSGSMNSTATIE